MPIPIPLRRRLPLAVLLCAAAGAATAQETANGSHDDVGLSIDISAEKRLSKPLLLTIDAEYRQRNNCATFDRATLGAGVDYKILPWLKGTAGLVFMLVNNDSKERSRSDGTTKWIRQEKVTPRYRAYAALTGSYTIARLKISLRERYQYTFRSAYTATRDYYTAAGDYNYSTDVRRGARSYHVLRSRLQVSYNIRHCPVTPYASAEIYNSLTDKFNTRKLRYSVGAEWKVNKQNALSLSWTYQDVRGEDGDDDANTHLIGVGYTLRF